MGTSYTVRSGDTLERIARRNGYDTWEEIYYHDENRAFRQRRPDPGRIYAGDTVVLPDRAGGSCSSALTGTESSAGGAGEGGVGGGAVPAVAPRRADSATARAVLNTAYELREVVVAQGVEARNSSLREEWRIPRSLQSVLPDNAEHEWTRMEDEAAEFVSHAQRVRFRIRLVTAKNDYKRDLQASGLHVVYTGHARYGRGPCFGPNTDASDDWENGTDPTTRGLYRMGYPVILIPIEDMDHHGYRFRPVPASVTVQRSWRHPEVPQRLDTIALGDLPQVLQSRVDPAPAAPEFWGRRSGRAVSDLLLWAGWENTASAPMDLGATDLRCRCFCHFGCSTKKHNWRIVRERKNWRRTDTDRFAYFTTGSSYGITTKLWLRAWLEYPRQNAFESWYRSLEWAKRRCNQYLRAEGFRYSVW